MDAVASRVDTAVRMNKLSSTMMGVVKGMDGVLGSMDPSKVRGALLPGTMDWRGGAGRVQPSARQPRSTIGWTSAMKALVLHDVPATWGWGAASLVLSSSARGVDMCFGDADRVGHGQVREAV